MVSVMVVGGFSDRESSARADFEPAGSSAIRIFRDGSQGERARDLLANDLFCLPDVSAVRC
jgi:hypothetical protein